MKRTPHRLLLAAGALVALAAVAVPVVAASSGAGSPGSRPFGKASGAAQALPSASALAPFYTASGQVSLSTNGAGSVSGPVTVNIVKPAGATVKAAFLLAAGTGFTGYTPVDGDVTINGTPVAFDPTTALTNGIGSGNIRADVTSLVAGIIDPAVAGPVPITLDEPNNTLSIDGEILAVVFNDPNVPTTNTVSLLYGAQQTTGDTFPIRLAAPLDLTDPNLSLTLGLGISYGFQPAGQYSQVDVNGQRLTTSAGGQDDGQGTNGALLTVGGVGDSTANPPDPFATDLTCGPPAAPLCDDELYDLKPFVKTGDTTITVDTLNPSNDDNIFFASLDLHGTTAVVGQSVLLTPPSDTLQVGQTHTATATVQDTKGNLVSGVSVTFTVTAGPNAGLTGSGTTNSGGQTTFSYSSSSAGTDSLQASFVDPQGKTQTSNTASVIWTNPTDPPISATGHDLVAGGRNVCGDVANFVDPDPAATAAEYTASVNWGDGTVSSVTVKAGRGHFEVQGCHLYREPGVYSVHTTITDVDNPANTATAASTVNRAH